ncbi:NAD-dependent epimerase/dehydratase family protein [Sulfurihydrogenibium azorense]|uniref:NAD-dependent epimerase/dehydratase family protein n=1 Tax=Sulfurihydrogenibium azorense TaxID=309806 RepID=UPI00240A4996|nr:NAD-dependent epimerase/dehydratase family protein [Sulfurihydrogenibium azorense]MDM7273529.1 NAD-dependent epimerase/dehydratase family protein [Sulfurihydrogenibium azorense]
MKYLITGGCGFLGSNLAAEVLKRNEELIIFDNLYRVGSYANLEWLKTQGEFKFIHGDVRNREDIEVLIKNEKPDVIFHLAGQVAMTTSLENPRLDFEVNALGTFNLLDAVRKFSPESIVIYSSSNKVYGDLEWVEYEETETRYIAVDFPNGFPESIPLDFRTPYGCSKGAADQYILDFYKTYGIRTVVFRHSSMYGGRQFSTYDQGWIGWFCLKAIEIKNSKLKEPFTIHGNGKQVRDVLHAVDMVSLYFKTVENIEKVKGEAFNIGGGIENSLSLIELFDILEKMLDVRINYRKLSPRKSDQKVFVADITKAKKLIGWQPKVSKEEGIKLMVEWIESAYSK